MKLLSDRCWISGYGRPALFVVEGIGKINTFFVDKKSTAG
jgi:hypothetical protein